MRWIILYFILFVLLTPGILLTLPPKGSKLTVALVHGVVFAVLFCMAHKYFNSYFEGALSGSYKSKASGGNGYIGK